MDSRPETYRHIQTVQAMMTKVIQALLVRQLVAIQAALSSSARSERAECALSHAKRTEAAQ